MENGADKELKSLGFPQHVLDGFSQGALTDLRVRFAMQILTHSPMCTAALTGIALADGSSVQYKPEGLGAFALDVACGLFDEAEKRGLISAIDHGADLPEDLARQAERIGAFEAHKQMGAQRAMKKAQGSVVPIAPGTRLQGH